MPQAAIAKAHVYFDTSTFIIAFILLGNFLEKRARRRTSDAITRLMQLQPDTASIQQNGTWKTVPVDQIIVGARIRITPGDRIPVDGRIVHGDSSIDESMVTGESAPVDKKNGDTVIGGTINISTSFEMEASKIGTETVLARIIALVQHAQESRAPVQKLVDSVSNIFVPTVIFLSITAFFAWLILGPQPQLLNAISAMVAVLIVACPCALGLATPLSIMVGIGRGAQEGILIKDAQTLEIAKKVTLIIFDKTGTLTKGKQRVQDFIINNNEDLDAILAVEHASNHPVSRAVVTYIQKTYPTTSPKEGVNQIENISGFGVRATFNNKKIMIGSLSLMEKEQVIITPEIKEETTKWALQAKSVSFVTIDDKLIAYFSLQDTLRDGAHDLIQKLKKAHVTPVMLTGDNEHVAQAVAQELGIEQFFAQVVPEKKASYVQQMQREGNVVAMVGDGVNDAPALATADIGIALSGGTDVALETAPVVLLRDDITLIPKVIALSRATVRNIRENLFWAFGYNTILVPVAMGILYPFFGITLHPNFAGIAMVLSSLSVVFNALRLRIVRL